MSEAPAVELLLLWHHHQPDYRSPRDGRAQLPWVRLHATKDYLDMALRLERHPRVRATVNFVPSLLDQLESAAGGDVLFDLLRRPVAELGEGERDEVAHRCSAAPPHALERWWHYRRLVERVTRRRGNGGSAAPGDRELLALEVWFLLAWLDPMFHDAPEARRAIAAAGEVTVGHRDDLLALHDRLLGEVIPAYRRLAGSGRVELSESPYYHPILPLLVDSRSARRARPDLPLPAEPLAAPEDARRQIERALERHEAIFGARPLGMWPPEGSVSPEAVELAARAGARWLASDEGVLWRSLPVEARKREALYRPWRYETNGGEVVLFFRDQELSDRIGFVYHHWRAADAVADFLGRLRRIGADHGGAGIPLVSVILDGENCWEHYPEDGGSFLEALYSALEEAPDIATRIPADVLARGSAIAPLAQLHSGSWIDADFHIWIGHPEKNRAWDLLGRTRRALVERGVTDAGAWEALAAAEGSDWFWWFGDDHFTADKAIFDRLFREHLMAAHGRAGVPAPGWLEVPIASLGRRDDSERRPIGLIHPTLDGRLTGFYEWHGAGRHRLGVGGGSMHRARVLGRDLYFGFDLERLYLRLDFAAGVPPGEGADLALDVLAPRPMRVRVFGLASGERQVRWEGADRQGEVAGARCRVESVLELAIPFASLGLAAGEAVEILGHVLEGDRATETVPDDGLLRFTVPDEAAAAAMWSA